MGADELAHALIAFGGRGTSHHDGDQVAAVTMQRGEQIESGSARETGFDAVHSIDCAEQMVVIAHRFAVIDKRFCGEISVVAWKPLLDGASKNGLIARGRNLVVVRQTRGIHVDCVCHAKRMRFLRHQLGKALLIPA